MTPTQCSSLKLSWPRFVLLSTPAVSCFSPLCHLTCSMSPCSTKQSKCLWKQSWHMIQICLHWFLFTEIQIGVGVAFEHSQRAKAVIHWIQCVYATPERERCLLLLPILDCLGGNWRMFGISNWQAAGLRSLPKSFVFFLIWHIRQHFLTFSNTAHLSQQVKTQ